MEQNRLTTRNKKITDPGEPERLLGLYAGIFPHAIKEFAEITRKRINRPRTNYSK